MRLTHALFGTTLVLTPRMARLDLMVAGDFRDAARDLIQDSHRNIILDLQHVTFLDSSGIGALVNLLKYVGKNRHLEICDPNPAV